MQNLIDASMQFCPHQYEGDKNWGKTKSVWAGVRVRREGLRITTKRKWKDVKHGLQTRYRVSFPGEENSKPPISAQVNSVTAQTEGWKIECDLTSPLDFSARIERWNRGVQFYSIEVRGKMKIAMRLSGMLNAYPDYSEIPPAIVIDPSVETAQLSLHSLDVDRVSKIGGEVAEQWGELVEKIIREVLLDDFNESLAKKLNRAIDKKRDRLRFSATDWLQKVGAK